MGGRTPEQRLARLQREQHGAFARRQALEVGVSAGTIDGRVRRGRYRVLRPGVYIDQGTPDSWEVRAIAGVLWLGGDAVLARRSAARVHGVEVPGRSLAAIDLLVASRCFDPRPLGLRVHRTRHLTPEDVTRVGGFPGTTLARTVVDLASELGPWQLRRFVASSVRDDATDAVELRTRLRACGPVAGSVALRQVLQELSPLHARCRSVLESDFLTLVGRHGLEPTAVNHEVRDVHGRRRFLDAVYLPERLPVELDSERFHSRPLDVAEDARRQRAIELTGELREPLRFSWADVHDRPTAVVQRIRRGLAAAS